MSHARLNYLELPASDLHLTHAFYEQAFGWKLSSFGETYSATTTGDVDIGLQAGRAEMRTMPLPVIHVDDLDAAFASVKAAGGTITKHIFSFPGGRRFHFLDPSSNELAAWHQE